MYSYCKRTKWKRHTVYLLLLQAIWPSEKEQKGWYWIRGHRRGNESVSQNRNRTFTSGGRKRSSMEDDSYCKRDNGIKGYSCESPLGKYTGNIIYIGTYSRAQSYTSYQRCRATLPSSSVRELGHPNWCIQKCLLTKLFHNMLPNSFLLGYFLPILPREILTKIFG